jgi:DNA-binding transcriptional regulator YdaS (Cro superfamily)
MSLASSRTPSQLIARQAALARALGQSASSMAQVSGSAAKLAHRGLKPIHSKATANAKRLGKR